jgi:hypothetical protein
MHSKATSRLHHTVSAEAYKTLLDAGIICAAEAGSACVSRALVGKSHNCRVARRAHRIDDELWLKTRGQHITAALVTRG